jgi:hypothetical protein
MIGFGMADNWFMLIGPWFPVLFLVYNDGTEALMGGIHLVLGAVILYAILGFVTYHQAFRFVLIVMSAIYAAKNTYDTVHWKKNTDE